MSSILKVSEIQDPTNANSALTIDSSGRVSLGQPIIVQAYMTTNMTATGIFVWNNKIIDTANAFSTSTGRFTCPKAGYYEVCFNYLLRACTSGHRTNVRKNGVNQGVDSSNANASLIWSYFDTGSNEANMAASTIVECAVNDLLDVHLSYLANGNVYGAVNTHNQLTIKFLG